MDPKNNYLKIPTPGIIFFSLVLAGVAFYAGGAYTHQKSTTSTTAAGTNAVATASTIDFAATKSDKPELQFFVMSFCPYGNQMEDTLRPVFDLLKGKANLTPHYIFDKIANLSDYCKTRSGDPAQCSTYITNGYFKTVDECKKAIADNLTKCSDDKQYLKTANGTLYASLHGRQEANEDVREMCAWNQVGDDKTKWWDFVGNVNKNCTAQNGDACWEQQAKQAGFDTNKITDCFNTQAVDLIEKELTLVDKYKVQGSPTVFVNDVSFPPETAYTQDGKGSLKIGNKVATQDKYRTPNVIKTAICASFNKAPGECNTDLKDLTGAAPAAGGCGN